MSIAKKRPAIIDGDIAKIPLGVGAKDGYAIVDADMAYLADERCYRLVDWGYAVTKLQGRSTKLHHIIAGRPDKGLVIDHIDGDPLNNKRENLRVVTAANNARNRKRHAGGHSEYKGVYKLPSGTWAVTIEKDRHNKSSKVRRYKSFANEKDAALQYDEWAKELFGEYARLNFTGENI